MGQRIEIGENVADAPSWMADGEGQTLEDNWLFRLRREPFRSRLTGKGHDFYVMRLTDAVNVIAVTPEDRIVLVRQFRAGCNGDSLETPGGLLDKSEDPRDAGARELLEETGYMGDPAILLGSCWSNPSILTSRISTIVIGNAHRVREPAPDEEEEIDIELLARGEILDAIRAGRIDHALAVGGLLLWLAEGFPTTESPAVS